MLRRRGYWAALSTLFRPNLHYLSQISSTQHGAKQDPDLWNGMPEVLKKRDHALKEIILKNIELFEIEHRGERRA